MSGLNRGGPLLLVAAALDAVFGGLRCKAGCEGQVLKHTGKAAHTGAQYILAQACQTCLPSPEEPLATATHRKQCAVSCQLLSAAGHN